jgi:hypothetical protein
VPENGQIFNSFLIIVSNILNFRKNKRQITGREKQYKMNKEPGIYNKYTNKSS